MLLKKTGPLVLWNYVCMSGYTVLMQLLLHWSRRRTAVKFDDLWRCMWRLTPYRQDNTFFSQESPISEEELLFGMFPELACLSIW